MAEIKRSRAGQSFLNKPIGVVNITTGAEKKYEAQAKEFAAISDFAVGATKAIQVKEGQDFAEKVKTRNEDGSINYQDSPMILGRFGRATSDEVLSKKFGLAQKEDVMNKALEYRALYKDEESFNRNLREYIKQETGFAEEVGGEKYASMFRQNAESVRFEHSLDIKNQKLKEDQIQTRSQYERDISGQVAEMASAFASGDFDEGNIQYGLLRESLEEDSVSAFGLSGERQRELLVKLDDERAFNQLRNEMSGMHSGEIKLLRAGISSDSISKSFLEKVPSLQEAIDQTGRNKIDGFINNFREQVYQAEQASASLTNAKRLMGYETGEQKPENSEKNRNDLDAIYAGIGVNASNIFSEDPAIQASVNEIASQAPFASGEMVRSFQALSTYLEPTDGEIRSAVILYRTINDTTRGNVKSYGIDDKEIRFLRRLDNLSQKYGDDPQKALAFARRIPQNTPEDLATISNVTGMKSDSGEPMGKMNDMMQKYIKEQVSEIKPEHVSEMVDYGLAVALSDPGNLHNILSDTYRTEYPASKYLRPSIDRRAKSLRQRSNHAPEAMLDREELKVFDAVMNGMLTQFYKAERDIVGRVKPYEQPTLGVDFYLDVVTGGSNEAQYKFVKKDGTPMINANGIQVSFGARQIKQFMERRANQNAQRAIQAHNTRKNNPDRDMPAIARIRKLAER